MSRKSRALPPSPFRRFNSSPEVIRLVVMMYVRFPLSLRNVEDLLFERAIDVCHETVRHWWNRFGPLFAADIRRQRISRMRGFSVLDREIARRAKEGGPTTDDHPRYRSDRRHSHHRASSADRDIPQGPRLCRLARSCISPALDRR
jgi:hypothetical protein